MKLIDNDDKSGKYYTVEPNREHVKKPAEEVSHDHGYGDFMKMGLIKLVYITRYSLVKIPRMMKT